MAHRASRRHLRCHRRCDRESKGGEARDRRRNIAGGDVASGDARALRRSAGKLDEKRAGDRARRTQTAHHKGGTFEASAAILELQRVHQSAMQHTRTDPRRISHADFR